MSETVTRRTAGQQAEACALRHLDSQGLTLVARNWSCTRGELDLVMLDGDTVVFVEVRYRRHSAWGGAAASVDARKQQKLALAAQSFLQQHPRLAQHPCRFDVIALNGDPGNNPPLDWFKNAFDS